MLSPRWLKVLRDLTFNPARTLLVIASIAVGIFAVGTVQQLRTVILDEIQVVFDESSPAQATIFSGAMDRDLLESVRRMPEVAAAEGRASTSVELWLGPDARESLNITLVDDFVGNRINLIQPISESGRYAEFGLEGTAWPLENEIVLERGALDARNVLPEGTRVGSTLQVETQDGRARSLVVTGLVYDANSFPATFTGSASGYVDMDTFERLGGGRNFSQLLLRFNGTPEQLGDIEYITRMANVVSDKIEKSGRSVQRIQVPEPGEVVYQDIFDSLALLLTPLGLLALFLSGFLVINTISALMAQQVRQIGIMKSIGAQRGQVVAMYLATVFVLSLLALALALPLTVLVSGALMQVLGRFINVDFPFWSLPVNVLLIQVGVGILVPLLASQNPIFKGTGVTVREAISDYGVGMARVDFLSVLLSRIRLLSRPLQLSLRNTFRRRARLALTLAMLVLGGMIFMTIGSVRLSLTNLIEQGLEYYQYDIQVQFERPYRTAQIEATTTSVPGVATVESWKTTLATRIRGDESESDPITLFALPAESEMVEPTLTAGRWLLSEDENAIVISQGVVSAEPDVKVGSSIILEIDGKEIPWVVVGIAQVLGGPPNQIPGYVNLPYFARATAAIGRSDSVQLKISPATGMDMEETALLLEEELNGAGLRVASTFTVNRIREISGGFFDIIVYLLSGMGVLIATVGALGLMGTMSTNVLERTREIGIMRSIGASDGAVQSIVIVEGIVMGLISWLIGALLAFPVGALISSAVGTVLFSTPLPYTFSATGVITWLAIVAVLAGLASFFPAWNASRLTVREVLAYE